MKNVKLLLFLFILMPAIIFADNFNDRKKDVNKYHLKYLSPERYLDVSRDLNYGLKNGIPEKIDGFNRGGFISDEEFELTMNNEKTSTSYLYDGTPFWTINHHSIDESFPGSKTNAKSKVTEYVLHDTRVIGNGKRETPWMFVDIYKVTLKTDGHGLIETGNSGEYLEQASKLTGENGSVTFKFISKSGFKYYRNDCISAKLTLTEEEQSITISNVKSNLECTIYHEGDKLGLRLEPPTVVVNTKKYGNTSWTLNPAVPSSFYSRYQNGYFRDEQFGTRIGLVKPPYLEGWKFDGYTVKGKTLINSSGVFEKTYEIFDGTVTSNDIEGHMSPIVYKVTLSRGTDNGTQYVNAIYAHDMPKAPDGNEIVIPKKPGYVFTGYYRKSQENDSENKSDKYYNEKGLVDSSCEPWNQHVDNPVIYAHYRKCKAGYKCPNGNDETPCSIGEYQNQEGQTTCKKCPVGTYNDKTGQSICPKCAAGSYQNQEGQTVCLACEGGKTSAEGATSCTVCTNNSYVTGWYDTVWNNNNTVSNLCRVKTCRTGYTNMSDAKCQDVTKPTCSIAKSNTGTQSGVTFAVTCSDNGSGCTAASNFTRTGVKSTTTYTVYDNAGNSNTCTGSVNSSNCNPHSCNPHNCNPYQVKVGTEPYQCYPVRHCGTCPKCTKYETTKRCHTCGGQCTNWAGCTGTFCGGERFCLSYAPKYECDCSYNTRCVATKTVECNCYYTYSTCYRDIYETRYNTCYDTCYDTCYS